LTAIEIGILSERRAIAPWGLNGGEDGLCGKNLIVYKDGHV
jgi:5-oxoprolinase (ATP-hydrolysing)